MAGLVGGLPSTVALSASDLDQSIQAIAHLVPGNRRLRSPLSRRALGAGTHMVISIGLASLYACAIRRRMRRPSLARAAAGGAALWALNYRLLGPGAMKEQDRSLALPDHVGWAIAVEMTLRALAERRRSAECG